MFILVLPEEISIHVSYLQAKVFISESARNTVVVVLFYFIKYAWNLNKIAQNLC